MIKGITHPDDAVLAAEAGAAAVIVSNHGGRQLDGQPGAIEVLGGVVEAVGDRIEVAVDGGFERGGDVVKALALGARAVLIGKAMCLSLAAGGEEALVETLARLRTEVERTLRAARRHRRRRRSRPSTSRPPRGRRRRPPAEDDVAGLARAGRIAAVEEPDHVA